MTSCVCAVEFSTFTQAEREYTKSQNDITCTITTPENNYYQQFHTKRYFNP